MNRSTSTATLHPTAGAQNLWLWGLLIAAFALIGFVFREVLTIMSNRWETPEYSHGYMIPLVSIFLVWQRLNQLPNAMTRGSWWGVPLLILSLAIFYLGELSSLFNPTQYAFLLSLIAISLSFFGTGGTRLLTVAFVYLIFMIPLPYGFTLDLSNQLQLLSSKIGVLVIRLFGVSVFLEGNVIDLGSMQLQVAEACSGLRYLFPLMSFGFLIALLYRGPVWQRAVLFLSTIPITVLMNSFRIGVIGVTVDRWGLAMAQGFLHDFEGWVVFMGCIGILFFEISCFHFLRRDGVRMLDRLNLDTPPLTIKLSDFQVNWRQQKAFLAVLALLVAVTPWLANIGQRAEIIPDRKQFSQFPLFYKNWNGRQSALDKEVLGALNLTDYIQADYRDSDNSVPINFYMAWYGSQKKGASIHSPRLCIPGGGWRFERFEQVELASIKRANGLPLRVNRAVIQKDKATQLVYYWFEGRNRDITDEYVAKWYIFWDTLTQNRSDGALVRVVTIVPDPQQIEAADRQIQQFLQDFYPLLPAYAP